ncbi:Esterase [Lachnellula occidentalis]|uniref:Esterase n=1 Tax=Lachnellula occidentalis TaxID=215460 RepID=A0A8H8SA69_9HELO|nr:Esterase [Lachnellula occidentalis]
MDPSQVAMLKAMIPKVPVMGKTALSHTFGFSEQSKYWDLRSALVIGVLRSFMVDSPPQSIGKLQKFSLRDPGIKGRIWISKVTMPRPEEDDIRQALFKAIEVLKEPGEAAGGYKEPELMPVEAEWTGYRAGATEKSAELKIPEEQKYTEMMKEATSPTTVLYFHGGAYFLMDPSSHRPTCKKLAKLTKGRVFSIRYRLAPQHPFPSALLDALVSYFTLLYPPPGSLHEAVKPEHIVFAGDSAGGNLCLVLLQTLLEFRRQGLKIRWNGEEREVPLPAGAALCSPWADVTHSSPSCENNAAFDYLPPPSASAAIPKDTIWPIEPARSTLYADDALLLHPLVSPIAAKSWEGSCPLYIETGRELLTDEDKYLAAKAAEQNVPVVFEEYEAMPHCFAMLLNELPGGRLFFESWAGFISDVTHGKSVETSGKKILAKSLKEEKLDVVGLREVSDEVVVERMRERVQMMSEKAAEKSKL